MLVALDCVAMTARNPAPSQNVTATGPRRGAAWIRVGHCADVLSAKLMSAPHSMVGLLALTATAVIAGIDYRIGAEISTSILYVLPVGIASWYANRWTGVIFSILSAATWIGADLAAGLTYSHPMIAVWNTLVRLGMFLIIANLLASFHASQDAAERLAQTDPLTGLANSRRFLARVDEEIARTERTHRAFTLVYTDLDNFKQVNDRDGHEAGNHALLVVAETLTGALRKTDLIARLGGDEFAILLTETDEESARMVCSHAYQQLLAAMETRGWPITFSSGAITFDVAPPSTDESIAIADGLMYQAKAKGKNRIEYLSWPGALPDAILAPTTAPARSVEA